MDPLLCYIVKKNKNKNYTSIRLLQDIALRAFREYDLLM